MTYPFKLLDAYLEKDKDIFFGRQEEIDVLYEMIFQTNVLLVYGASGTGKTSLIQCGLARKFQTHDWLALNIRRGTNINESFEKAIAEAAGNTSTFQDRMNKGAVPENINPLDKSFRAIYLNYFRPIYLIFDQLEEIYILGNKEEQDRFISTVKQILTVEQPVKIIFSIREEYLAFLYEFEKSVPQLLRKKLRVEKMNLDKVRQVISGITSSNETNIRLAENETDAFVENLFSKVKGEEKTLTIQLPYLQVYLDKLYLHITKDESRKTQAVFSFSALSAFGDIDDVLKDFLEDQVNMVTKILAEKKIKVSRANIWSILWPFITLEGTKAPTALISIQNRLQGELDHRTVEEAVNALVSRRVLRYLENDNLFEIAHDSLGSEIAKSRSPEQSRILESEQIIKNNFSPDPTRTDYLNARQIEVVEPVLDKLKISEAQKRFVAKSIQLERLKSRTKRAIILATIVGLIIIALIMTNEKNKAETAKERAEIATKIADSAKGVAIISQQEMQKALQLQIEASRKELFARMQADSATKYAESAVERLKIKQREADSSAKIARQERDNANEYARVADSSKEIANQQTLIAKELTVATENKKNITQSIQFALQSILSENTNEKIMLARKSYDLNAQYNKNAWVPQITEALAKAIPLTSVQRQLSLPNAILDIIPANESILLITDAGEIRSFDLRKKDSSIVLWKDKELHYVNNSGYFDREKQQLSITDRNSIVYLFTINKSSAVLKDKYKLNWTDSFLMKKETLVLFSKDLRKQGSNGNNTVFNFKENFGSTFEIGAGKNFVAAGTTNGWLYLSEFPTINSNHFEGLFQIQNTRVNDIAFDKQGSFFATAGADSRLRLTTIKLVEGVPLEYKFKSWVNAVLFVDHMKLLIATEEGKLYLLNFDQDELAESCRKKMKTKNQF